jgi:hypothetical protein
MRSSLYARIYCFLLSMKFPENTGAIAPDPDAAGRSKGGSNKLFFGFLTLRGL